jgi:hypothetical protein
MLLVKTKIKHSKIHGIGLFADQFIPKGTVVWKFNSKLDTRLTEEEVKQLSEVAQFNFRHYCYVSKKTGFFILPFDDIRFLNHSGKPNLIYIDDPEGEEGNDVAMRDINKDEELTEDYSSFDKDYDWKMSH